MSADPQTIQTYDQSAAAMMTHFQKYKGGIAQEEIERVFTLLRRSRVASVVEIGCGAGKDAVALVGRTESYEGFDPSIKLLEIARERLPQARFVQADALGYTYPKNVDVVFAFASLLHLNRDDFALVCRKVAAALKAGGIFCLTLKEADEYTELRQQDTFGSRLFYLYPASLVQELAGKEFTLAYEKHTTAGPEAKRWMSLIFVKR